MYMKTASSRCFPTSVSLSPQHGYNHHLLNHSGSWTLWISLILCTVHCGYFFSLLELILCLISFLASLYPFHFPSNLKSKHPTATEFLHWEHIQAWPPAFWSRVRQGGQGTRYSLHKLSIIFLLLGWYHPLSTMNSIWSLSSWIYSETKSVISRSVVRKHCRCSSCRAVSFILLSQLPAFHSLSSFQKIGQKCSSSCFLCLYGFVPILFPFSYSNGLSRESRDKAWGQAAILPRRSCGFMTECSLCPVIMPPFRPETSGNLTREGGDGFHAAHEFPGTSCPPFCCALLCHTPKSGDGSRRTT